MSRRDHHRPRRRSTVAKDLGTPKYAPRVVAPKKPERKPPKFGDTFDQTEGT